MFVLPPPPKYSAAAQQTSGGGSVIHPVETSNTLQSHEGNEYQLVVGEGTYVSRDDLHLATPPPHPSEAPVVSSNPLATTPQPPSGGTKLSLTVLTPRKPPYAYPYRPSMSNRSALPISIQEETHSPTTETTLTSRLMKGVTGHTTVFGDGNAALIQTNGKEGKDAVKKRKPKSNIIKTNSSFVSRVMPHENLTKRLQERSAEGLFAFANINRAFQWLDLDSPMKAEHLTKILFTKANPLCHQVNPVTKSPTHLDVIIGFNYGDIIWYEPMSQKYSRINKNGMIHASPVSDIAWLPGSENLFLAAHMDGTMIVYDKEKEDATFVPEPPIVDDIPHPSIPTQHDSTQNGEDSDPEAKDRALRIEKSVQSRNQKTNPVAVWKISNQRINAFAFSPDGGHLAVVSEDGTLRIIDYVAEKLLDLFPSYYGGFTCVCWSPDARYVLTGGQDDLVSIWSVADATLVARCQGHNSWVTQVAFDPWRCDERNYRFGSVGDDCRLLLWDFSVGMLKRPKATSVRQRGSISSHQPIYRKDSYGPGTTLAQATSFRSNSSLATGLEEEKGHGLVHDVEPRAKVAMLPPIMAKQVDKHPLCWLGFEEGCIMTSCKDGHIHTWNRPRESTGGLEITVPSIGDGR